MFLVWGCVTPSPEAEPGGSFQATLQATSFAEAEQKKLG
jgi:hypothetical protein